MIIGQSGPFEVSQTKLNRIWPGGIKRAQELGNSVLYPKDVIGRSFQSPSERSACELAFDWLKSRIVSWPKLTKSGGYAQTSIFDQRIQNLRDSFRYGTPSDVFADIGGFLDLFHSLTKLFGDYGVGQDVRREVVDMGLQAAPLVAAMDEAMYELTECMCKIFRDDNNIVPRMIDAISPFDQQQLEAYAKGQIIKGTDPKLPSKIIAHIKNLPGNMIVPLVRNNMI